MEDNKPTPDGTIYITFANKAILKWDQLQFQKTKWIDKRNNCFTFHTAEENFKLLQILSAD